MGNGQVKRFDQTLLYMLGTLKCLEGTYPYFPSMHTMPRFMTALGSHFISYVSEALLVGD